MLGENSGFEYINGQQFADVGVSNTPFNLRLGNSTVYDLHS